MKMVSAKLKKAQDAITAMRYAEKLTDYKTLLHLKVMQEENSTQRNKKSLVVAITSNRGLCGAFNSNVIGV
jgi:F-type H+-transporting ATPase subunit gamma